MSKKYNISVKQITDTLVEADADAESFADFFKSLEKVIIMRVSIARLQKSGIIPVNEAIITMPDYFTWIDDKGKGEDKITIEMVIPKTEKDVK